MSTPTQNQILEMLGRGTSLPERLESLARVLEAIPGGIIYVRLDRSIASANQEAQRVLGLSYDQITGYFIRDWAAKTIHEDGSPFLESDYPVTRCLQTGLAQPPATVGIHRPDGKLVWGIFTAIPVVDPKTGQTIGAVVTFLDITQRKLAEERIRFQAGILAQINDAVIACDADRIIVYFNHGAEQIYGFTQAQALGQEPGNLLRFNWGALGRNEEVWQTLLTQRAWHGEVEYPHPDGRKLQLELSVSFRTDPHTHKDVLLGITRDITQRKRTEEQLLFQAGILAQINDAVYVRDADNKFRYWNRGAERIYGLNESQVLGKSPKDVLRFLWPNPGMGRDAWAILVIQRAWHGEVEYLVPNGNKLLLDISSTAQTDPATGKDVYLTITRDITGRHRTEMALRDSEERYRNLVENSPDAVYIRCADQFAFVNQAAVRLFGAPSAEALVGRRILDFYLPEDHPRISQRIAGAHSGISAPPLELKIIRCDGSMVEVEVKATPCVYMGKPALQAVVHDLTQRKKAEETLRRSEEHYRQAADSNRRLLQEVNHRVRNNLGNLLGLISLSRRREGTAQEFAAMFEARVMAMAQIHNLLAQTGWRDLDLRPLLADFLMSLRRTAPHDIPVHIDGPVVRIGPHQVMPLTLSIQELFTNSCKYGAHSTPSGQVRITWEAGSRAADGGVKVLLVWEETGGPPPPAVIKSSLGTELIEGFISFQLGGSYRLSYLPTGARNEFEFVAGGGGNEAPGTESFPPEPVE